MLEDRIIPKLNWFRLEDEDWILAADYWAKTVKAGRALSDMDFLLASMVSRLDAILVSSDNDFDALPIKREDWR